MPYTVDSTTGRIALLGALTTGLILVGLWFTSKGPFARSPVPTASTSSSAATGRPPRKGPLPSLAAFHYPPLNRPGPAPEDAGAEPDFDPLARPRMGPTTERRLPELLQLLPQGYSVVGLVRVAALRKETWAASILAGRRLSHLRAKLAPLGLDPTHVSRAVFGIELEARALAVNDHHDTRFLGKYDRPFCLVVEGPLNRKHILQRFRKQGPLAASVVMGRRVYRREGDYALVFPVRGLVAWTYRRPMAPVLKTMLEDAKRSVNTPALRAMLRQGGFYGDAPAAPRPRPRPRAAPPAPPRPSPAPRDRPRPRARRVVDRDRGLPWVTLLWAQPPNRRVPYPFNRLRGYGQKSALRGAVLTVGPSGARGRRIRGSLRLLYKDAITPTAVVPSLRFVRRYIAANARIRKANLKQLVESASVEVVGRQIRISVELRPWHVRAMMLMFHKLLEGGT